MSISKIVASLRPMTMLLAVYRTAPSTNTFEDLDLDQYFAARCGMMVRKNASTGVRSCFRNCELDTITT